MKKTLFASSLALTLGLTGVATHATDADASEMNIDKAELAQLALNNDASLNEQPVQEGAYDYTFTVDGVSYHFWSDGVHFGWSYDGFGNAPASAESTSVAQPAQTEVQDVNAEASQSTGDNTASDVQQAEPHVPYATQAPAPATTQTSTAGSGVNSHLELIKSRESGGDYGAINPTSGAAGAYQFLPSTWNAVAQSIDPSYVGVNPASAPASVQDRFAQHLYNTAGPGQWVTA
ncbi:transglycosylase family protein [Staphylococcus canis]|uniref:Transglycosylase family protein n=1 Tax=Staphylococcus canis TaxID=2724942 RepID=A0ABS0T951_9STAP|nr:transglycosylase family protein [Staphylococcus canis]MBI5974481.1 transglycosylase family protein [Staphylococcus canis]